LDKLQPPIALKPSSSSSSLSNYPLSLQSKIKFNLKSSIDSSIYKSIHVNSNMKYLMLPNNEENELSIYNVSEE